MRHFSGKIRRENQNTHFMFSTSPPPNRAVYEIMWGKYGRARQATEQYNMAHAHCMPDKEGKDSDTHPEYLIVTALPR